MATAPTPGVGRREAAAALTITIKVDGKPYTLHVSDLGGTHARMIRQATGHSLKWLMDQAAADPDIDILAALVWLARFTAGEVNLTLADVEAELTYDADFEIVDDDTAPPEDGELPE